MIIGLLPKTSLVIFLMSETLNSLLMFMLISLCSEYFNPTLKPTVDITTIPAIIKHINNI